MKNMKRMAIMMLCVLCLASALTACGGCSKKKCDNCGKQTTVFNADVNSEKMKLCSDCIEKLASDKTDEFNEGE